MALAAAHGGRLHPRHASPRSCPTTPAGTTTPQIASPADPDGVGPTDPSGADPEAVSCRRRLRRPVGTSATGSRPLAGRPAPTCRARLRSATRHGRPGQRSRHQGHRSWSGRRGHPDPCGGGRPHRHRGSAGDLRARRPTVADRHRRRTGGGHRTVNGRRIGVGVVAVLPALTVWAAAGGGAHRSPGRRVPRDAAPAPVDAVGTHDAVGRWTGEQVGQRRSDRRSRTAAGSTRPRLGHRGRHGDGRVAACATCAAVTVTRSGCSSSDPARDGALPRRSSTRPTPRRSSTTSCCASTAGRQLPLTVAAQRVQVSAFPDRYGEFEQRRRAGRRRGRRGRHDR